MRTGIQTPAENLFSLELELLAACYCLLCASCVLALARACISRTVHCGCTKPACLLSPKLQPSPRCTGVWCFICCLLLSVGGLAVGLAWAVRLDNTTADGQAPYVPLYGLFLREWVPHEGMAYARDRFMMPGTYRSAWDNSCQHSHLILSSQVPLQLVILGKHRHLRLFPWMMGRDYGYRCKVPELRSHSQVTVTREPFLT